MLYMSRIKYTVRFSDIVIWYHYICVYDDSYDMGLKRLKL